MCSGWMCRELAVVGETFKFFFLISFNILKVAYREMVIYCASCMCLSIRIT